MCDVSSDRHVNFTFVIVSKGITRDALWHTKFLSLCAA